MQRRTVPPKLPLPCRERIAAQEDGRPVGIIVIIPSLPPPPPSSSSRLDLFSSQFRRIRSSCHRAGSADSGCRASRFTIRLPPPPPLNPPTPPLSIPPSSLVSDEPPRSFLPVVKYHDDGPCKIARHEGMRNQVGAPPLPPPPPPTLTLVPSAATSCPIVGTRPGLC